MLRFISVSVVALLGLNSVAHASELARINAVSCGHATTSGNGASSITGSRYSRGVTPTFAAGKDGDFPSMVKLKMIYQQNGYTETEHCGGTVIDSRYIATAAHCVTASEGEAWDRIEIVTGSSDLESPNVIKRTSQEAICHAGHDPFLANDIALIKLSEPLPKEIVPAQIDDFRRISVKPGSVAVSAGWPVTGSMAGKMQLNKTALAVTEVKWPGFITVSSPTGQIEGVCQGESGGPLMGMINGQPSIAGVLSGIEQGTNDHTGEPCMKPGYDMYYTPISAYRNWIDSVMSLCSNDPDACRPGAGSRDFFLSSKPVSSRRTLPAVARVRN